MKRTPRKLTRAKQSGSSSPSQKRRRSHAPHRSGARGIEKGDQGPFVPPERWHEPANQGDVEGKDVEGKDVEYKVVEYKVVVEPAGDGFDHVITPDEVRERLSLMPDQMLYDLEVVQLSCMTKKKRNAPCYGMQWGSSLYLYPIETELVEIFTKPPKPSVRIETKMYGGRWVQDGRLWKLMWTPSTIRDFYLNNILIHELGHLLDDRNTSFQDRERWADWFAIQYGYKPSRMQRRATRSVRRHGR
ncbi:MAG: hypothetical protein QGG36_30155 [Pirellulaceae bacterium]|nr:hypothetical protein [Pirellulaceae bacterium]